MTLLTGMLCRFWRCASSGARARGRADSAAPDDLTAIRGIGIAIQNRLNLAGIRSYGQLAGATPEELRHILGTLGRGANVEDWIAQAKTLASEKGA